jgi:hypothetical protein
MRHARAEDLARIAPLLEQLRALDGLTERTPGAFYRGSKAFLHFHADGVDMYADVRITGPEFDRRRTSTKAEQRALVSDVRKALR